MRCMKKYALLWAMLLTGSMAFGQSADDPTIMTIAHRPVSRSEFEYSYNKNNTDGVIDRKSVQEYVDLFINYKLKVQAALDARLDTMTSFRQEYETYRDQQVVPTLVTDADVEAKARAIYEEARQRVDAEGGLVRPAHILFAIGQRAPKSAQDSALALANRVEKQLRQGADFAQMAQRYSADKATAAEGGLLPWVSKGQLVPEFEQAVFAMKPGELSKPVLSPYGYHLILLKGKQNFFPYDSVRASIVQFIEARNLRQSIAEANIDTLVSRAEGKQTREDILDAKAAEMAAKDSNMKYLFQEYHDGLLLYEISNRTVWEKASKDEAALAAYFRKNKKKYAWQEPHFKGIAYHVKNKADLAAVRSSVKGKPFGEWAEVLRSTFNNDSVLRIRVEKGIFKRGDNALVDREVFGRDTVVTPMQGYPYEAVYGKILKKGPETYEDVRALVVADRQEELEKQWVARLRKQYEVTVNKQVLATVNQH